MDILITFAILGSGVVAGIFFAFSTFVMRALRLLPPRHGIAAMNTINVTVINPWFLGSFFGTGVACIAVVCLAEGDATLLAGSGFYLVGCLLVTMARNVPLNKQLASVAADSPDAEAFWTHYLSAWTFWNHVRTAASLVAAAFFVVALWA